MSIAFNTQWTGARIIFGVPQEVKPVVGAPPGRQRVRLRRNEFAILTVRMADGVRRFHLKDVGDHWEPFSEIGRNVRRAA